MTHTSQVKYGRVPHELHSGAKSGEVRTRYFDPVTGEPCDTKPKPRAKKQQPTVYERDAKLAQERKEATEIMQKMAERKKPKAPKGTKENKRAVLVDGVLFESVTVAAQEIGTTPQWLGHVLKSGVGTCKGRTIQFAEKRE